MTTREKIVAVVDAWKATPADELPSDVRDLAEAVGILQGLGIDLLGFILPQTDAEADVLVDKVIALALEVRGDDLPPFDFERYGESTVGEGT